MFCRIILKISTAFRLLVFIATTTVTQAGEPTLYGTRSFSSELLSVNTNTGAATPVANIGYTGVTGLTYSQVSDTLYGYSYNAETIFTIDPKTGRTSRVAYYKSGFSGMVFDDQNGFLFGVDGADDTLVRIDPKTGASLVIGDMGFDGAYSLAIDTITHTMYTVDVFAKKLLTVDMETGLATVIAENNLGVGGLTFDPVTGMLLATNNHDTGAGLYTIDPISGRTELIGEIGYEYTQSLAYVYPSPGTLSMVCAIWICTPRRRRVFPRAEGIS